MSLIDLANPSRFSELAARLLPWLIAVTLLAFAIGGISAYLAPDDYQQGATVKIMFIHVPAAWLGIFAWVLMSVAALGTLVWRHPLADVAAKAAAPIGAAFTLMCLLTGSLWGRPMWGTYWVWDARLTSVLILFLMYLGVIALWRTVEDPTRAARAAAVLTLVGCEPHEERRLVATGHAPGCPHIEQRDRAVEGRAVETGHLLAVARETREPR